MTSITASTNAHLLLSALYRLCGILLLSIALIGSAKAQDVNRTIPKVIGEYHA